MTKKELLEKRKRIKEFLEQEYTINSLDEMPVDCIEIEQGIKITNKCDYELIVTIR